MWQRKALLLLIGEKHFHIPLIIVSRTHKKHLSRKWKINQSHAREFDSFLVGEAIVTMKPAVSYSHVRPMNVAVGYCRLTNAALEAINVVEEAQVLNYHRRTWPQFMIAIRAKLFTRDAQNVHRWQGWNGWWRQRVVYAADTVWHIWWLRWLLLLWSVGR